MIFEFIEDLNNHTIDDRNLAQLTVIKPGEVTTVKTLGSLWIMSSNAAANLNKVIDISHCTWASGGHKTAKIIGSALIIDNTGYSTTEPKLATVDPTKPGQLSYIDGCSNTNLIDPLRNGDPCINYLHFPPGIDQTWHTHPSYRIGYVISGSGHACVKESGMEHQYPLRVGRMFILHRHALHRFVTTIDSMSLMVYHPDSEDGPRDENNPMKARTYLQR